MIELVLLMSYVTAAIRAYGGAVLEKAQDDAAEATVGLGRRVLQRIFGTARRVSRCRSRWLMWRPTGKMRTRWRRCGWRSARPCASDPKLNADVEGMLASAGVSVTAAGERSIAAQTITGIAATGDNTTINKQP